MQSQLIDFTLRFFKWFCNRMAPAVLALMALIGLWFAGQQTERVIYGVFSQWSAKPALQRPVQIILIDPESMVQLKRNLGNLPASKASDLNTLYKTLKNHPDILSPDKHFGNFNSTPIALIAESPSIGDDDHQTPATNRYSGPDIYGSALENIIQKQSIQKAPAWLNFGLLTLLCTAVFLMRLNIKHFGKTLLYTLGTLIIYCWIAFWLFSQKGFWLDVITPELFIAVAFLAGSSFRIVFQEKQLAMMERNMAQLVDPEVFQEIRRMAHILKPGGQKLEITSMFVDIRDFTTLAERLPPHELTELLNAFYEAIVKIVFTYRGTVDKFMGDGILMIFGAPLSVATHAALAVQAAMDMLVVTQALSVHWKETRGIDTEIGISIHSGPAFVGFLGPTGKLEYTAVGDTVNLCVRLQEHAKKFNTRLIISERTLEGLQRSPAHQALADNYLPLGEVQIRGRESGVCIYTLPEAYPPNDTTAISSTVLTGPNPAL